MRLDGADRDPFAVRGLIATIERRAAVDDVVRPPIGPDALLAEGLKGGHEMRDPIHHRDIERLALPGFACVEHRGKNPDRQIERASAEVGDEIERRGRGAIGVAERVERPGEGEIIDVVAGFLRERPLLSPSGHAGEDEARIGGEAEVGTEAQPLHDAGPEALDQGVGPGDRREHRVDRGALLEVERDRAFVAIVEIETGRRLGLGAWFGDPIDAQNIGAEIAEQRSGEWRGSDPAHFDDPKAG